eukprot:355658-Chlamydomonas_euryale.AAC.4
MRRCRTLPRSCTELVNTTSGSRLRPVSAAARINTGRLYRQITINRNGQVIGTGPRCRTCKSTSKYYRAA